MDKSAAFAASAGARANATGLDSFLNAFPKEHLTDTHEEKMYDFAWGFLPNASLESYLLQNWFTGRPAYDAVFINSLSNSTQVGLIHIGLSCCLHQQSQQLYTGGSHPYRTVMLSSSTVSATLHRWVSSI